MRCRSLLVAVAITVTLSGAGITTAGPAGAVGGPPPALGVTTVVGQLNKPWDLAFTPRGGILFTERPGPIKYRLPTTGEVRTLADPTDVVTQVDGGMLGIAIDPDFGTNRRVYTCFMSDKSGVLDVRLVRWRLNEASTALRERTDIVTGLPVSNGVHAGCRPRFGPDGNIWMGTGDAGMPTVPQDPTSLGGKVLRVDVNGQGVPGNAPAPFDPRIYSYGHRNVQGIAFSHSGKAYSIEHGTDRDDEVNRLLPGANYGWDPQPLSGPVFYDQSRPMTDLVRHPTARVPVWSSGFPTIAPSGGTFLVGPRWEGFDRCLAMAVLKDMQLRVLCFDATGKTVISETTVITDRGRLRSAVADPLNNNLYLTTDANPGSILKVIPS